MADRVVLPKLGLTATGARLVGWLVTPGERIEAGTELCEIETDKITVAIESPYAGTLLARAEVGLEVPVGAVIALIGTPDENVDATEIFAALSRAESGYAAPAPDPRGPLGITATSAPGGSSSAVRPSQSQAPGVAPYADTRISASPAARALASQRGIDLATVVGTGPGGRITLEDVEAMSAMGGRDPTG
jgi:pyruvate dehydrogenase E2 component (dihydrolipoamide acetyltransferase)